MFMPDCINSSEGQASSQILITKRFRLMKNSDVLIAKGSFYQELLLFVILLRASTFNKSEERILKFLNLEL